MDSNAYRPASDLHERARAVHPVQEEPEDEERRGRREQAVFGACYLGLELWKRLQLDRFFEEAADPQDADVPWSRIAAVLAINRLCAPGSELAIEELPRRRRFTLERRAQNLRKRSRCQRTTVSDCT
jgi:hypothetical protein